MAFARRSIADQTRCDKRGSAGDIKNLSYSNFTTFSQHRTVLNHSTTFALFSPLLQPTYSLLRYPQPHHHYHSPSPWQTSSVTNSCSRLCRPDILELALRTLSPRSGTRMSLATPSTAPSATPRCSPTSRSAPANAASAPGLRSLSV